MKLATGASLKRGRVVFFLNCGIALLTASRTMRRCTPSFLATPVIVPTPNSYSLRISSNNSTFDLQSNDFPPTRAAARIRVSVRLEGGPKQNAEPDQIRVPKSEEFSGANTVRVDLSGKPSCRGS